MGGRMMPIECHHGATVDYGDFGPHQNGCPDECFEPDARCPDVPVCDLCEAEVDETIRVYWEVLGDAIRGFFMEKHLSFDSMDEWTDEIVAIVREHRIGDAGASSVPADRSGNQ